MSKPKLRVFSAETQNEQSQRELDRITGTAEARTVAVPLGKVVPLLMDAWENERAWLNDFAEDLVRIDSDLYDVLLAYQTMQQRAAA
jgi:hypothetical protein